MGIAPRALLVALLFGACSSDTPAPEDADLTRCSEPRPQICTREYRPVCAEHRDGSRRTYATGCVACSAAEVVGHRPGACPEDEGG